MGTVHSLEPIATIPVRFTSRTIFLLGIAVALLFVFSFEFKSASAQQQDIQFQQLSKDVRGEINEVRQSCKDLDPNFKPNDEMQGITIIDLNGDGSLDLVVDNKYLCNEPMRGANCSNRGCDLTIWKQQDRTSWKKSFAEHVSQYFLSVTYQGRFRLLAVSVVGGNAQCKALPTHPEANESCDALVYHRQGRWVWQPIK